MSINTSRRLGLAVFGVFLAVASGIARADWACTKPETDVPAAQKELYTKTVLALRTAFMVPPDGWIMRTPTVSAPGSKFCIDFKNDPVSFGASTSYIFKPTAEALRKYRQAQAAQRAEIDALKVLPPDLQAKIDELENQGKALRAEAREAERAKNRDLAKAKYDEAQDLSRKSYAIRNEYSLKMAPQERAVYEKYRKDMELNRDIHINVSLDANGAPPPKSDANDERVVFGNATAKTNQSTDKLLRITARFERGGNITPEQLETVKKLVDRAKLQAMIAGNIPSVEESKAAIAQQNEAITVGINKAREFERAIENEGRREAEAAQIAKRQAAEADKAASATTADKTDKVADKAEKGAQPAATKTEPPAATAAAQKPATPPTTSPSDAVKDAKDTVNKLRGLLGR
jgi:hypothetical protein